MPLTDAVQPLEPLARFLWAGKKNRKYDAAKGEVYWDAFDRSPQDGKTSVYRTLELDEAAIWALGRRLMTRPSPPLGARAELIAEAVLRRGLTLEPAPLPDRHTNIAGWPAPEEAMSIAIDLAKEAKLIVMP